MSTTDFSDIGLGPGIRPASQADGQLLPEQMDQGVGAVYDRAIKAGATPEQAEEAVRVNVYGVNYKRDKRGNPIGDGIGAPGRETINHFAAIRKWEGEVAYQSAIKKMWANNPDRARKIGLPEPTRASA
jgi:hypothetical protein